MPSPWWRFDVEHDGSSGKVSSGDRIDGLLGCAFGDSGGKYWKALYLIHGACRHILTAVAIRICRDDGGRAEGRRQGLSAAESRPSSLATWPATWSGFGVIRSAKPSTCYIGQTQCPGTDLPPKSTRNLEWSRCSKPPAIQKSSVTWSVSWFATARSARPVLVEVRDGQVHRILAAGTGVRQVDGITKSRTCKV